MEREEEEEIHETKPSRQGTLHIFMNSNVLFRRGVMASSDHLRACTKKPSPAHRNPQQLTLGQVFQPFALWLFPS